VRNRLLDDRLLVVKAATKPNRRRYENGASQQDTH